MKRTMTMILCSSALVVIAFSSPAADRTLTGKISDSVCAPKQAKLSHGGSDHACVLTCVKAGAKYVFISEGKVYKIDNQDFADLKKHAGETVRLTGDVNGKTIRVSKITISDNAT
jgi:hypothetical protein